MKKVTETKDMLTYLAGEIKCAQMTINVSVIQIGNYLDQANQILDGQVAFLAWSKKNCGYSKAMSYKLINIAKHFEGSETKGIVQSIAIMEILMRYEKIQASGNSTPEIDAKVQKIKVANAKGVKLPVKAIEPAKGTKAGPVIPKAVIAASAKAGKGETEQEQTDKIIGEHGYTAGNNDIDLRLQYQALQQELQEAQHEIEDLTSPDVAIIPTLSQFRSAHSHVALGLTEGQSRLMKNVKNSANELTSIWTAQVNKEAYSMIIKHRDALLKAVIQSPELKIAKKG